MKTLILALTLTLCSTAFAQPRGSVELWPGGAPGALGTEDHDSPTITMHFPNAARATGASIVICPGGGYGGLAHHEGDHYAMWLNEMGIAGFVLKYRLGSKGYRHPAMLNDVSRAVRVVRANAEKWKLDPERIGVMGSSAGGHLAATLLAHFTAGDPEAKDLVERLRSRPNLGILCYPVITMGEFTHRGSRRNLLGKEPTPELIELLSNEKQIKTNTPPTFVFHTVADRSVPIENALLFVQGLRSKNVPFALHVYPDGDHGMGLGGRWWSPEDRHPWTTQCAVWLKDLKFAR